MTRTSEPTGTRGGGDTTAPDYRQARRENQEEGAGMAVDYGGVIYPAGQPQQQQGVMGRIEEHPYVAIFIGLVLAVVVGFLINKVRGQGPSGAATPTTNQPGTTQGLPTTDAQGNKVYYVPTSNTFLDYNNIQSSYNPNNSVATTTTSTSTVTNNSEVDNGQHENPPPSHTTSFIGSKPLIPYGQYKGPSYSNLAPNTHYTYNGVNYRLQTGAGGRLWGITPWGAQYLLYGPSGYYGSQFQDQTVTIPAGYPSGFNPTP
jgi:hypothetical protein